MPFSRDHDLTPSTRTLDDGTIQHYVGLFIHRLDGPAVIYPDDRPNEWHVHSVFISNGSHPVDHWQSLVDLYELSPEEAVQAGLTWVNGMLGKDLQAICRLHTLAIDNPALVKFVRSAYFDNDHLDELITAVEEAIA